MVTDRRHSQADIVVWRRASRCVSSGCVEVQVLHDGVLVRDSKAHESQVLTYTHEEWTAFVEGVKAGEFDLPQP